MSGYRKLGRTSAQRKAMLRNLATNLLYYEKIVTTEARAKEVRKIVEKLITMAIKEKDNYDQVVVKSKVAKKDENGRRIKKDENGKRVTIFEEIDKEIKKDRPSRLNVRRKILSILYPIKISPKDGRKKRQNTVVVDIISKLFDEIGKKYVERKGGYTRIVKIGPRKGDGAPLVLIELV